MDDLLGNNFPVLIVRDCLSLMLPTGLLFVPVLEDEKPADVISMRDVMLFLAQES